MDPQYSVGQTKRLRKQNKSNSNSNLSSIKSPNTNGILSNTLNQKNPYKFRQSQDIRITLYFFLPVISPASNHGSKQRLLFSERSCNYTV